MNIWKLLLTFPYFLHSFSKAKKWSKKIYHNPNVVSEENRYYWIRRKIRYVLWLSDVKIAVIGWKNWIDGSLLVCSNHQSNWDALILFAINNFSYHSPCAFIAKHVLINSKIRYFAALINILYLDRQSSRSAYHVFQKANEIIRIPRSLMVFPEGTRNRKPATLLPFKPEICKIAKKSYVPILPCTIINSFTINRWSQRRSYVLVVFSPIFKPANFISKPDKQLMMQIQKKVQINLDKYRNASKAEIKGYYKKYRSELKKAKKEL